MDKLEKNYDLLINKLKMINNDNENAHILQDEIYRKFIKEICNNKFTTIHQIKKIANNIDKNVIKMDNDRWYA